eukprot:CAMPEP_0118946824 /NCGR_PEP_ID=MMETSP1169-20130426/44911_1 /TAXON_ID=36882 /ORGANISM="Pyramimonas obovata, Strain CCMP722" /LENGTH=188 /DNA_ID=CAMNT_0006892899 /DNA_START=138 /DNA_END=703 /DNA_ORIENTATION=+
MALLERCSKLTATGMDGTKLTQQLQELLLLQLALAGQHPPEATLGLCAPPDGNLESAETAKCYCDVNPMVSDLRGVGRAAHQADRDDVEQRLQVERGGGKVSQRRKDDAHHRKLEIISQVPHTRHGANLQSSIHAHNERCLRRPAQHQLSSNDANDQDGDYGECGKALDDPTSGCVNEPQYKDVISHG